MLIRKEIVAAIFAGAAMAGCTPGTMAGSSEAKSSNSAPAIGQLVFAHDKGGTAFSVQYDVPGYGAGTLTGAKPGQPVNNMTCTGYPIRAADPKAGRSDSLVCQGAKLSVRQSAGKDVYDVEFYISRPSHLPAAVVKPGYDLVPTSDGSDLLEKISLPPGTAYRATFTVAR